MGRENRADDEGKGAEGREDTGEREEEEEELEDDEAPGAFLPCLLLVLSLFHHHRGCVVRKSHAHDCSLRTQIL